MKLTNKFMATLMVMVLMMTFFVSVTPSQVKAGPYSETVYVINCYENITLRKTASTSGKEICKIPLGAAVTFYGEKNGFYEVSYQGKTGYVLGSYCTLPYALDLPAYNRIVNCKEWVTLRLLPDTKGEELTKVYLGEYVNAYSDAGNGFAFVIYNGQAGYILSQYISGWDNNSGYYGGQDSYFDGTNNCLVINCDSYITLRKTDNTSGKEICKIDLGSTVYYLGDANNGFIKVAYNGQVGYVLEDYIAYMGGAEGDIGRNPMRVANCKEFVTLRTSPSTSASGICTIPLGDTVFFLGKAENDFYYVYYNGSYGYVLSQYLKSIWR